MSNYYFYNQKKLKSLGRYLIYINEKKMTDYFKWKGKDYIIEVKIKKGGK